MIEISLDDDAAEVPIFIHRLQSCDHPGKTRDNVIVLFSIVWETQGSHV
jgi:hypothetical protein